MNVTVKAGFEVGSFEIVLELVQKVSETVKFFLENKTPFTPANVAEIVGLLSGTSVSVIGLIKWLRGRPIKRATIIENGNIKIETLGDYDSIEVSEQTVKLFRNPKVRKSIYETLAPLDRDGVETFSVKQKKKEIQTIRKSEKSYFIPPEIPDEELLVSRRKAAFNVIGVFFEENLKWKLFDGETRINAIIKDEHFLKALESGRVSFTKGDILEVELKTQQWKTEKGLKTEHEVTKVIRQIKSSQQLPLPFENVE